MNALLRWLYTTVTATVARGKVTLSQAGRRGLVQVQMLEGEVKVRVEHLLPYGRTARPTAGDAVLLTVGGTRDHVVCICVDDPALRIPGLAAGEFGDSDGASMVVYRSDSLRILSLRKIAIQSDVSVDIRAPAIHLGALGEGGYVLLDARAMEIFNTHTHPSNGAADAADGGGRSHDHHDERCLTMAASSTTDPQAFSVLVDGKVYPNWTEVRVSRGIDRMASEFELSVVELWDGRKEAWNLQPFTPCTLMIGNDPVLTGFIDSYVPAYSARSHQVRVAGRSKTQDIIDCTPDLPGGQFSGYNLGQIAGAIAQPFGIRVHVLTTLGEPFYDATIDRHETGFQFLERLARLRGVLLCDDELGDLLLTSAGRDRAAEVLVQGENILSATANLSGVGRFSEYRVKTTVGVQTAIPDLTAINPPVPTVLPPTDAVADQFQEAAGEDAPQTEVITTTQAVAYDPGVPRFRPHVMLAESGLSADMARRRAAWQAKYNAARGTQLHVDLKGWRQVGGRLWRINEVVSLRSPYLQVDMELLIVGVTFELRAGQGRTTRLDLGPIDGYTPDPGQVKAHRNRGQAAIYNDLVKIPGAPPGR